MPDLESELAAFGADGPPTHPLPAAEVRRRGDRLRRRRLTRTLVATVAAVAIVAGSVTALASVGHTSAHRHPPVAPAAPPDGWLTTVPTDFPLGAGLPAYDGASTPFLVTRGLGSGNDVDPTDALRTCAGRVWRHALPTPATGVRGGYGLNGQERALLLYASAAQARAAVRDLLGGRTCHAHGVGFGDESASWRAPADNSERWGMEPASTHLVVRVGNAVLTASARPGDSAVPPRQLNTSATQVVDDMCVYDVDPCTSPPAPPATPTAEPGWLGAVPGAVDLATGLEGVRTRPEADRPDEALGAGFGFCATPPELENDRVVTRTHVYADGPSHRYQDERRTLLLYPDGASARRELRGLEAYAAACRQPADGPTHLVPEPNDLGRDSSLGVLVDEGTGAGYGYTWERLALVGNALLITETSTDGGTSPTLSASALQSAVVSQGDALKPLLRSMRVFRHSPTAPGSTSTIPADFPLLADYPPAGKGVEIAGPSRTLTVPPIEACGPKAPTPAYADRVSATYDIVATGDHRARELTVFASPKAAQTYAASLRAVLAGCPIERKRHDVVRRTQVRPGTGEDFAAAVVQVETDGSAEAVVTTVVITRVGPAVLVATAETQSVAVAPTRESVRDAQHAVRDVIAAMCVFSDSGCPGSGNANASPGPR